MADKEPENNPKMENKPANETASPSASENEAKQKPIEKNDEKGEDKTTENLLDPAKLGILNDVSISLTIEVGRAQIKIRDLLTLTKGSIIELNKSAGEPVDIYANGKLISIGNIITANGKYCVRLTAIPESSHFGADPNGK
ncbi:flagellar motor switch protein FliN [Aquicella lusitana]|uniref:Flagellar motor switch protein FliN n=1 Tax=Aquicella lusitana TaxID=254246 RepID=A0A370G834_9COXI|nr:flagellar motor switch protein FliN [Aquicella lusitana]RDI39965.1 flagellar motor switch protein FliN/FliY [Aquicella lusitana]VVC74568.1 Flagellar motor switch protein FliN [Aquicella lusitana]